jgi:hypothetical protein
MEFHKPLPSKPETIYVMTITKDYDVARQTANAGGGGNETRGIGLHYTKLSTYAQKRE